MSSLFDVHTIRLLRRRKKKHAKLLKRLKSTTHTCDALKCAFLCIDFGICMLCIFQQLTRKFKLIFHIVKRTIFKWNHKLFTSLLTSVYIQLLLELTDSSIRVKKKTPKILPIKTRANNNSNNELELKKTQQVLLRLDVIRFAWNLFLLWSLSLIFSLIHFQVDFFVEIHGLFVVLFIFFWEIGFVFHEIS